MSVSDCQASPRLSSLRGITVGSEGELRNPAEAPEELGNGAMVLDSAGRHCRSLCTYMLFRFKNWKAPVIVSLLSFSLYLFVHVSRIKGKAKRLGKAFPRVP